MNAKNEADREQFLNWYLEFIENNVADLPWWQQLCLKFKPPRYKLVKDKSRFVVEYKTWGDSIYIIDIIPVSSTYKI